MKVFVSSKEVSCFTPTQGDNKAEVKNTYDGYWPLTFQLEMPLIPLKKQGRWGGKVEIKMNFLSSPMMRWAKWKRKGQLFRAKTKTMSDDLNPTPGLPWRPWLSTSLAISHWGSGLPEPPGGIFSSVLLCPSVNRKTRAILTRDSLTSPPATFPLTPDTLGS